MNEYILVAHSIFIAGACLFSLRFGKASLMSFISLCWVLANLFVGKQIILFGFSATCADALAIGATLGLNLMQEYYGRKSAQQAIWISFSMSIIYTALSMIHLWYEPALFDTMHYHHYSALSFMPRIIIASLTTYIIAQYADYFLFGFLKRSTSLPFALRSSCSALVSQLLDTILFSFLALYGIVDNVWHIILISYAIKCLILLGSTPFLSICRFIVKKERIHEGI